MKLLKIGLGTFLLIFGLLPVSASTEDIPIKISDDLTLHSGDIITLQANDNTYVTYKSFVSCLSKTPTRSKLREDCLQLTDSAQLDANSEFIVETAENDQIRLRTKERDLYIRYFVEPGLGHLSCVGFPFILVRDTAPSLPENTFTVVKTGDDNKIALRASNDKYLGSADKYVYAQGITSTKELFGKTKYRLITPEADSPVGTAVFTVDRTGIDSAYVQSVSDIEFDLESLIVSTTPYVISETTQLNNGSGEMQFLFAASQDISTTNKWTWEKGTEFKSGVKLTGKLEIPIKGVSAGIETEVSTEITESTKDTTEYTEEITKSIGFEQTIQVPAYTKLTAKLIGDMAMVDVPYTALVTVKSEDDSTEYSYPINGTYQSTTVVNVHVEKEEEPLIPTSVIDSNVSETALIAPG